MLGKHCSGTSHSPDGCGFNATESTVWIQKGVFTRHTHKTRLYVIDQLTKMSWPEAPRRLTLCFFREQWFRICEFSVCEQLYRTPLSGVGTDCIKLYCTRPHRSVHVWSVAVPLLQGRSRVAVTETVWLI